MAVGLSAVFLIWFAIVTAWTAGVFILVGAKYYFAQKGSICKKCGGTGTVFWLNHKSGKHQEHHEDGITCTQCNGVGRIY